MTKYILLFLIILLNVTSCKRDDSKKISITGSSTVAPLARELGARFEEQNPGVRVDVQMGGSSRGLADVRKNLVDIGMISRDLSAKEKDVSGHKIALDGIAIIVNAENKITSLSSSEIAKIYLGEVENWKDVGGSDAEITVVNKAEGRSTLELFTKHFSIEGNLIKADVVIGDNEQGIQTVAGNPNAIGYVSVGTAEYDVQKGIKIKLLKTGGVDASRATVKDGSFPIVRSLNFITKEEPKGLVKEFIKFSQSAQVHDLIEGQFFVPLGS